MRLLTASLLAMSLAWGAQAQQSEADEALVKSVSVEDMRSMVEAGGHTVTDELSSGVGVIAQNANDLIFAVQGKACSEDAGCLGVEFFVVLAGDFTTDDANSINQRWSAIKATRLDEEGLMLSRYLILDHGQTQTNLDLNLATTLAIATQIQDENAAASAAEAPATDSTPTPSTTLAWGDDTGDYANDDACDDGRFQIDGDEWSYQREHVLRDATDCREAYEAGTLTLYVDFGNNSGEYANDGTCDDNRFTGEGRSVLQTDSHIKRDSEDCVAAYRAGTITRVRQDLSD
ncbi:MAG: hypothetical protein AAGA03_06345 [Planctomycetota bacterium]